MGYEILYLNPEHFRHEERVEFTTTLRVSYIWVYRYSKFSYLSKNGGQYLKDNIWRTKFEGQYLKNNIWRSYLNNMWTIEFFLKDNIWEGQYFNIILDTGDTPIFFRFFSKNLEIFQKKFYTPRFYFFDFLSKNLKFRNFLATPKKNFWPPKKI